MDGRTESRAGLQDKKKKHFMNVPEVKDMDKERVLKQHCEQ